MDCKKCRADKPESDFIRVARYYAARERHHWCNDCRKEYHRAYSKNWAKKYPERLAQRKRRTAIRAYGITVEQYEEMRELSGGVCAICKTIPKEHGLQIDHCHASGVVRGLLCKRCNLMLGAVCDSEAILLAAAKYLHMNIGAKDASIAA